MDVSIVSAEKKLWEGEADIVIARSPEGEFGIMRGHIPFLAALVPSKVTIGQTGGERLGYIVTGGFLEASGPADDYHVIILADEFAGSDGDIITQVSKLRGIGPVIGTRTWGGVVGIDSRFTLADGTGVTQPRYATWFGGGVGWDVENHGVAPDIEVTFPPHAYAAGRDPQLATAVDLALTALAERPAAIPPDPATRPSRVRPPRVTPWYSMTSSPTSAVSPITMPMP